MKQEEFDELSTGTLDSRDNSQQYRVFHINLQNVHFVFHAFASFRMTQALLREEEADTETSKNRAGKWMQWLHYINH